MIPKTKMQKVGSLFSSLRIRLGFLILLAVLPAMGMTIYTDMEERELAISNVEGDVQQMVQFLSMTEEQFIEGTRQLLISLANHPEVRGQEESFCARHFAEMIEEYPRYVNLGAAGVDGEVFCSAFTEPSPPNLLTQSWFIRTLDSYDFTMGMGSMGQSGGKTTLNFGYPVIDDFGVLQGVVFAAVGLDQINQITGELRLQEETELILVTQNGTILAYVPNSEKWVGQSLPKAPLIKAILSKGTDVGEYDGLDGSPRLYAFTPVRSTVETGVYICIGIPTSIAYSEANKILAYHVAGLGLVTFLALMLVWVGGDVFIIRRVNALVDAAQRLSGGDMKARTGLRYGAGELDQLARGFDEMAETLELRAMEIRQAESRYRTLVEQLPVITYTAKLDHFRCPLYVSPQVETVLGFTPEEYMADASLWFRRIHPDDLDRVRAALLGSCRNGETFRSEYRIYARDGRLLWFNDDAVVIHDEVDGFRYLQGIMGDVTDHRKAQEALKESEERFRLLVERVKDYGIFMLDPAGRVVSWNAGTERLKGYEAEEIVGEPFSIFYAAEDMQGGMPERELETARVEGWFEGEGWRVRKDGSRFWASVIITALHDKAGGLIGFSHITRDLTEYKRAEEKLIAYQDQLRSLASELSLTEERQRRRIATELHDRVGQALAISKIKLGVLKSTGECEDFDLLIDEIRKLIEQAIQDTRSLIFEISSPILYELGFEAALEWLVERVQKQHGIHSTYEDDEAPKPLDDDIRALLFQAAGELLMNAAKHAQPKHIKVGSRRNRDCINVSVEDDGIGFEMSESRLVRGEGMGFGLFSIRERLNYVGGCLEISSVRGMGTRVTLVAPLKSD